MKHPVFLSAHCLGVSPEAWYQPALLLGHPFQLNPIRPPDDLGFQTLTSHDPESAYGLL